MYARESLTATLNNTGVDIYVNDFYTHEVLYVNRSMAAPYGGVEKFQGRKCYEVLYEGQTEPCEYCPQLKLIDEEGKPTNLYSWDYQRPSDKAWFHVKSAAFHWVDGRVAHIVSSIDITENRKNQLKTEKLAFRDALTNLGNRRCFDRDFEQIVQHNSLQDVSGYLLFCDLDNFKRLNDTHGHHMGDLLLQEIAIFAQSELLLRDKVYRYGGDEFIVLLNNATEQRMLETVRLLTSRFSRPWNVGKYPYLCTCSIGVSRYPDDGIDSSQLVHNADTAMYNAKQKGKARVEQYRR